MDNPLEVIVAGQVMLLLNRHGLRDARCLSIYRRAVLDAVRHCSARHGDDSLAHCTALVREQMELLERALLRRLGHEQTVDQGLIDVEIEIEIDVPGELPGRAAADSAQSADVQAQADDTDGSGCNTVVDAVDAAVRPERLARQPSGYVPTARSMEEKLQDEREPIQKLLLEDCVSTGLIDVPTAQQLIQAMVGKTARDAERDIVEHLRQVLQQQARYFIRKAKGGPWANPRAQEDLRKDIHASSSVRSVLMLHRQIVKEYQTWQQENGRVGILGLFSTRRRMAK